MTLKIRSVVNQIKYPKSCEAQVRLVLECLEGHVVDVQVTNMPAEVSDPDDWVSVCFADDSVVYFRLNQPGEFCRIEKLIEFNQRFSRLAQQRRRKIGHLIQEAPRGGSVNAYQVRIIDPEGHARTEVVVFERRSLNQDLAEQGLDGHVKILISGQGSACGLANPLPQSRISIEPCCFVVNIGNRCFPIQLFSENGVNCMEILEKQIVVEPAMAGTSPISISIGAMEIPIRDLLDLRPGSKVILDHPGSQALRAWIYLGLETVAKGHLVPGEQGWEFCVEEIAAESELFAA